MLWTQLSTEWWNYISSTGKWNSEWNGVGQRECILPPFGALGNSIRPRLTNNGHIFHIYCTPTPNLSHSHCNGVNMSWLRQFLRDLFCSKILSELGSGREKSFPFCCIIRTVVESVRDRNAIWGEYKRLQNGKKIWYSIRVKNVSFTVCGENGKTDIINTTVWTGENRWRKASLFRELKC